VEVTAGKGAFVTAAPGVGVAVATDGPVAVGAGVNGISEPRILPHALTNIDINKIKYGNRFSVIPPWFKSLP